MNTQVLGFTFGLTFIIVGLFGFIPNPLVSAIGLFLVNAAHNVVHIVLGIAFVVGCYKLAESEDWVLKFFGVGGLAVTTFGFVASREIMLAFIPVNEAGYWLHLGLGLIVLASGFMFNDKKQRPSERSVYTNG